MQGISSSYLGGIFTIKVLPLNQCISPPKQSRERDINERGATALGHDHSLADWFGDPVHVPDLVKCGEERHVGHSEEGRVRVPNTVSPVKEIEFPEKHSREMCSIYLSRKRRFLATLHPSHLGLKVRVFPSSPYFRFDSPLLIFTLSFTVTAL